jgi:hypothetical protein
MKCLYIIIFLIHFPIFSHTIIFKDLKVVQGIVYKQDNSYVYFHSNKGEKKVSKDSVGKIIVQDISDTETLKKLLGKVKHDFPDYKPSEKKSLQISENMVDIEIVSIKEILAEIEKEEEERMKKEQKLLRENKRIESQSKHKDAILKALILPGWGHVKLNKENQGYMYGSLFAILTFATSYQNYKADLAHRTYDSTVSNGLVTSFLFNPASSKENSMIGYTYTRIQDAKAYHSYEEILQIRNNFALGMLSVYLIQLAHCYYTGRVGEGITKETRRITINMNLSKDTFNKNTEIFTSFGITFQY